MSEAEQVRLSYALEALGSWGTTPAANLQVCRYSGESLKKNTAISQSPEIGNSRTTDVSRSSVSAGGSIQSVLSFCTQFSDWLLYLVAPGTRASRGAWSSQVDITANDVSVANADNSFNSAGSNFTPPAVGSWVRGVGYTNAANNLPVRVVTATTAKLTVEGSTLVDESAAAGKYLQEASQVDDGDGFFHMSIEKEFQDLSNIFQSFLGMVIGGARFRAESGADAHVGIEWDLMGKDMELPTSTIGTGYTAKGTTSLFNVVDNVKNLIENTAQLTSAGLEITISRALRPINNLANLSASDIELGPLTITGSVRQFFQDTALLTKYANFTGSKLAFVNQGDGGAYVVDFPAIDFHDGEAVAGGRGQSVIAQLPFTSKEAASPNIQFRVARFTDA